LARLYPPSHTRAYPPVSMRASCVTVVNTSTHTVRHLIGAVRLRSPSSLYIFCLDLRALWYALSCYSIPVQRRCTPKRPDNGVTCVPSPNPPLRSTGACYSSSCAPSTCPVHLCSHPQALGRAVKPLITTGRVFSNQRGYKVRFQPYIFNFDQPYTKQQSSWS
jgi:hypothetical protein